MKMHWSAKAFCMFATAPLFGISIAHAVEFKDVRDIVAPTKAVEMIYSPTYNNLVIKNTSSAISVLDLGSNTSSNHFSNYNFTDMSVSPSGRYVYAADYGGENIGYGTPLNQSYVHRLDLSTGSWEQKKAYIAGNIQATSDSTFVLKSKDQWVTFTNNAWGSGSAVTRLDTNSSWPFYAYYASVYYGDFRYDQSSGRILHGNSDESSHEIQAFRIGGDNDFFRQEGSGIYGSADSYGGTVALATDGSAFYYGSLQVDPLDVTHNLLVFPELIYAATGDIAFGNGKYYDAHTGALLGSLGFDTTSYALDPDGSGFWAYDESKSMLREFSLTDLGTGGAGAPVPEPESYAMTMAGCVLLGSIARYRRRKSA